MLRAGRGQGSELTVSIEVGSRDLPPCTRHNMRRGNNPWRLSGPKRRSPPSSRASTHRLRSTLRRGQEQPARARRGTARSVNPGKSYNPLFIYGGVGLGKTHLMQAVGNAILEARTPAARVAYVHSEKFVGDMVRGLQHNTISEFKRSLPVTRCAADRRHPVFCRQGALPGRVFPYLQCAARGPAADHPDLRPLSEGSQRPRGAAEVALRLGPDGRNRTTRARDLGRDSDEQGRSRRRRDSERGRILHRQAHSLERA